MRHALERQEFLLYYEPKQEITSGRITGMEALLRWQHPDLGIVAPMQFIPVAEETGLIVPISKWVLRAVCLQNVAWQSQGLPELSMAVNLTSRQFSDDNLLPDISRILRDTGMKPQLLELEITESLLIHDVAKTLRIMTELKAMGIKIAVDDFGTCYASLSNVRQFPLDTIKIDRSFIRDVSRLSATDPNPAKQNLADAIICGGTPAMSCASSKSPCFWKAKGVSTASWWRKRPKRRPPGSRWPLPPAAILRREPCSWPATFPA